MRMIRIIFPFLFVRNWYTGQWEVSQHRLIIFGAFLLLFGLAIAIVIALGAPVRYSASA
jgi:hypothetical protein